MDVSQIPILLTSSAIAHDKGVQLRDSNERAKLAIESVKQWRIQTPNNPLVLCDGSGFDFSPFFQTLDGQASVECLRFDNDSMLVERYGRGFGEGEIVRHALNHSQLISKAGCFAKCTSKLWVDNFHDCMHGWNGRMLFKGVFDNAFSPMRPTRFVYIDTRFYAISTAAYLAHFSEAHHQINAASGHGLEECFLDIFLKENLQNCLMDHPPVICGVGGGTGKLYKNTRARRLKERLRYKLVKHNALFQTLFV